MTSKQIKDLIRNQAKKNNIDAQILLRNYMLERLLERIALSKYNSYFILKGGMLVAAMVVRKSFWPFGLYGYLL